MILDSASADRFMFSILTSRLSTILENFLMRIWNIQIFNKISFDKKYLTAVRKYTAQLLNPFASFLCMFHPRESVLESHSMLVYKVVWSKAWIQVCEMMKSCHHKNLFNLYVSSEDIHKVITVYHGEWLTWKHRFGASLIWKQFGDTF